MKTVSSLRPPPSIGAACLALALLGTGPAMAEPQAFRFGVGAHFAFNPKRGYLPDTQRPHIAELGIDTFRDDVDDGPFREPTARQPLGPGLPRLGEILADRVATPVLILRGRNLGSAEAPRFAPRDSAERGVFSRFSAEVVRATRAFDPIYEIWNEWNMQWRERAPLNGLFGPGAENPDYAPENYVAVARDAFHAIKAANPDALVLTGSIGEDADWTWTRRALRAGLAETGDGLSLHLYNHCNPVPRRTAEDLIARAGAFKATVEAETGEPILPTFITEFGWPNDNGPCGIPLDLAAANTAQFTLWATTTDWIKGVWVYELRDSGQRPEEREDNFGLYDYENRPKPAACAYREAIALARGASGKRFLDAPSGFRWMEAQGGDGGRLWVVWTTARGAAGRVDPGAVAPAGARVLCAGDARPSADGYPVGPMPLVLRVPADADPRAVRFRLAAD